MEHGLYDNIYNPDVLSCIANLSNDEVFTPPKVANRMLDMLPQELFSNPDTTFLDPAVKSGVFLREIAKCLLVGLEDKIPNRQERVDHMVSKDGGAANAVTPAWSNTSVDVHVGTFTLTEDGDYTVTINYKDKSSNTMATYTSKQMTIDTKIEAPTYTINGVAKTEAGGAYKGEATIGFNFADQNFDTKTIKLSRTRFDKVEDVTETFVRVTDNDKGGSRSFTIPSEVGNDGIYVLKIGTTDKAKHTIESEIKITINRFGSVYEYGDELVNLIKDGGQYITSIDKDPVITEYNADRLLEDSLKILITRDGETVDADYTSNLDINVQVGVGESG